MRNLLLIALCGFLFTSCQKELEFDSPLNPPGTPGIPGTPGPGSGVCFTCDYFPLCDNSKFEYVDSLMGAPPTNSTTIVNLLGDSSINGAPWKKIKDANSGQRFYTNCDNGVVKLFISTATSTGGNTVNNIIQTPIKANAAVGESWTDAVLNHLGQQVEYRYTLIAKNLTRQVMDSTYNNVIYVRDTTCLLLPGMPVWKSTVRHIYFAKAIGQVEVRTEDISSGSALLIMVRKLKKYNL